MLNIVSPSKRPWVSLVGRFIEEGDDIVFKGYDYIESPISEGNIGNTQPASPAPRGGAGQCLSNQRLTEGTISVGVEFQAIDASSVADIMLQYDPETNDMLTFGLNAQAYLSLRYWGRPEQASGLLTNAPQRWNVIRSVGDPSNLEPKRTYRLEATIQGSFFSAKLDGVEVGSGNLPFQLSGKQVGLFCANRADIHFRSFRVESRKPVAFIVMQFNPPEYEELFEDVIVPVCENIGLEPFRASQTYYPGLVIADIQRQIRESRVVIAEITPGNPNVYYEVGYADAIGKPVILIADGEKTNSLPFDVRAYRTLFYENTIGGKSKVERALNDFLINIMNQKQ